LENQGMGDVKEKRIEKGSEDQCGNDTDPSEDEKTGGTSWMHAGGGPRGGRVKKVCSG
jgi:hypothetical protein